MQRSIVLGTRGSDLALAQARIAAARITAADPSLSIDIRTITTSGDRDQRTPLSDIGGKGVFIKELEEALCNEEIDVAVHSFKDITVSMAPQLELCAFFTPESVCDVLVTPDGSDIDALAAGARVGTGSMRRRALLSRMRPDIRCTDIRGNLTTRIDKCDRGMYDAVLLSEAGLIRIGLQERISQRFDPYSFYPAPGQGVIALQIRRDDAAVRHICICAGDDAQKTVSMAELHALSYLGFDCRTPLGIYTRIQDERIGMYGFYVQPQNEKVIEREVHMPVSAADECGTTLARMLLQGGG